MKKKSHVDIMHFIALKPIKRGSFEDFVMHINTEINEKNKSSIFVFDDQISPQIKKQFDEKKVQYRLYDLKKKQLISFLICILRYRPKICHFHFVSLSIKIVTICSLLKIKIFYTIHDSIINNNNYNIKYSNSIELLKFIKRKFIISRISKIITVSEYVRNWVNNKYNVPEKK